MMDSIPGMAGVRLFQFLRTYRFMCEWAHMHICTWMGGQRTSSGGLPQESSSCYLRQGMVLSGPHLAGWSMKPRDVPVSASPALGLQGCAAVPADLLLQFWGSNSGLRACMATTLMASYLPSPISLFIQLILFSHNLREGTNVISFPLTVCSFCEHQDLEKIRT